MIGCGFVPDYYIDTLANYPWSKLAGVMARNQERAVKFSKFYSVPMYNSLDEVLAIQNVLETGAPYIMKSSLRQSHPCLGLIPSE
jgi:NAD-dependent oxidoreductase involved in siderophore biosynthesis